MNATVEQLMNECLSLSASDRSALVAALIDSLEGHTDSSISDEWRKEILARRDSLRRGEVMPVPWAEVRARLGAM